MYFKDEILESHDHKVVKRRTNKTRVARTKKKN